MSLNNCKNADPRGSKEWEAIQGMRPMKFRQPDFENYFQFYFLLISQVNEILAYLFFDFLFLM